MSKRPFSAKSRVHARPSVKRCPSGGEVIDAAIKAANKDIDLPQELCDDSLLHVLSYADTPSLVHFARGTNNAIRDRCRTTLDYKIWKNAFDCHNLAPLDIETNANPPDYYNALRRRLTLFSNLSGKAKRHKKQLKHSYNLPSRFFHFVPILPNDLMHYPPTGVENNNANDIRFHLVDPHHHAGSDIAAHEDNSEHLIDLGDGDVNDMGNDDLNETMYSSNFDPPPVEFSCDSYTLTSAGTGSELVFLNPFSGTVEVRNVLDNAVGNDESILERAMLQASESILNQRQQHDSSSLHNHDDESSEIIAGEAFHRSSMYDTPPKQILYSVDDYFDLDLNEYFGEHTPFKNKRSSGNVTSDWVGVDSHSALSESTGTLIGAARILSMESEGHGQEELACTEVFTWSNFDHESGEIVSRDSNSSPYCFKHVVKIAGSFYFLDVCANKHKVFAAFQAGSCPFEVITHDDGDARRRARSNRALVDINDNDSVVNEDGEPIRMSRTIFCLPLVKCDDTHPSSPESIRSQFPTPDSSIKAQYPVSSFSIDPTGNKLVVGTVNGTVEIWDTSQSTKPRRMQLLSVRQAFLKRHRAMTFDVRNTSQHGETNFKTSDNEPEDDATIRESNIHDDIALLAIGEKVFPHKHPTSKISQIYLPRHLTAQKCGFVTKQRNAEHGTTLLLWQIPSMFSEEAAKSSTDRFKVTAMINVPLSAQCHPEVHYDGRRLLVFGKDHIGLIVLVYHVLGTRFDQDEFDDSDKTNQTTKGEESGGVINLDEECRVKFVNRIRHAGLDGLEYFDSMLMTANERYIVLNTKAGHLIGCDRRNASEGLLIIDLEDAMAET